MIYYVIRFTTQEGGVLYAGYSEKGTGAWAFSSEGISARKFKSERVAKRVVRNTPPYKQMVAEGCSWEVVKITEEVIERATPETV